VKMPARLGGLRSGADEYAARSALHDCGTG
jgi:hypothetical protein